MTRTLLALPLLSLLACPAADDDTAASGDSTTTTDQSPGSGLEPTGAMVGSTGSTGTTGASSTTGTSMETDPSGTATSEDDPGATGESSDTTTDSPGQGSTATTTEDSTSTTTGDPSPACDPWLEDCPEGQKCAAHDEGNGLTWTGYQCVPIAPQPGQAGEPCVVADHPTSGLDTCDEHLMCWDLDDRLAGHCVAMCDGTPDSPSCADPESYCAQADNDVLILCLPGCDPLVQDCPAGEACYPHHSQQGVFACYPDASGREGQVFDACEFLNVCDPGLLCLFPEVAVECDQDAQGCCMPYCELDKPNPCPGVGQECLPLFEQAPPKYEDLGACSVWE